MEHYSQEYLRDALERMHLEPPDMSRSNGTYEALYAVYEAHKLNGISGARIAWNLVKRMRPELTNLEGDRARLIHADQLKNLSMPIYLLEEYAIYLGGFNVLAGASGGGKSFIALDISGKIAREHGAVVYIAGEGLSGYAARWEAWKAYNRVEHTELYFYTEAVQVMNVNELNEFIQKIAEHNPSLVVIDTLARSAIGVEENSAREIGMFVGACDSLRYALNCAVLVVHHTGKDGKIRGSSALYAAADSVLSLTADDGRITLRNDGDGGGKNKHAPASPVKYFKITPYAVKDLSGAVLIPADKISQNEDDDLTPNQQEILQVLENTPMHPKDIAEAAGIGIATVYRNLKQLCELELATKLRDGRYAIGDVDDSEVE
jgi:hypothetical protein